MLYPEGKSGKKHIADNTMELIKKSFNLPCEWMDVLIDDKTEATGHLEFAGNVRAGFVPVTDGAALGINGSMDMIEFRSGWLGIYSGDKDVYGLKVKGDSMQPRIQSGEYVVIEPDMPVHPGDKVFVRTKDGRNMIKIMNKTRDGDYQFSSINSDYRPITSPIKEVDKMHFASAIAKRTRHVDQNDLSKV